MGYSSYCVHIIMVCIYYHAVWCISSPIKAFHSIRYTHVIFLRAILMYINQFKAPAKHVKISFFKNILICFRSWVLVCGCIFKTLLKISAVGGGYMDTAGIMAGDRVQLSTRSPSCRHVDPPPPIFPNAI